MPSTVEVNVIRIIKETTFKDNPYGIKDAEIEMEQAIDTLVHVYNSKIKNCQFDRCVIDLLNVDVKDCTFCNCWFINLINVSFLECSISSSTIHLFASGVNTHRFKLVKFFKTDTNDVIFSDVEFNNNNKVVNIKKVDIPESFDIEYQILNSHF